MPDDRPLSKDLQPGTVLRAGLGRVVTLDQRAMNCWLVFVPSVMGTRRLSDWLSDDAIDAPDTPWSILPSDEPPAVQVFCARSEYEARTGKPDPALPSDEEAEPPADDDDVYGSDDPIKSLRGAWKAYLAADGPLDPNDPQKGVRTTAELRYATRWGMQPLLDRLDAAEAELGYAEQRCMTIARWFGWEGKSCSNETCICEQPNPVCEEFMGIGDDRRCPRCGWGKAQHDPAYVSRLEAVVEAAREMPKCTEQGNPGSLWCTEVDTTAEPPCHFCVLRATLATLDTSDPPKPTGEAA